MFNVYVRIPVWPFAVCVASHSRRNDSDSDRRNLFSFIVLFSLFLVPFFVLFCVPGQARKIIFSTNGWWKKIIKYKWKKYEGGVPGSACTPYQWMNVSKGPIDLLRTRENLSLWVRACVCVWMEGRGPTAVYYTHKYNISLHQKEMNAFALQSFFQLLLFISLAWCVWAKQHIYTRKVAKKKRILK